MKGIITGGGGSGYEVKSYNVQIKTLRFAVNYNLFPMPEYAAVVFIPEEIDLEQGKGTITGKCRWVFIGHNNYTQPLLFAATAGMSPGEVSTYNLANASVTIDKSSGYCQLRVPGITDPNIFLATVTVSGKYILLPGENDGT